MTALDYWRSTRWRREGESRRATNPVYLAEEEQVVKWAGLITRHGGVGFSRVLEVGVGYGRHLRNLVDYGLDAYGFDVSRSMVAEVDDDLADRVTVGDPGSLPYPSRHFGVAFTCSVLLHIPPDEVADTIREMRRVANLIFHIEPAPGVPVEQDAHQGCWNHDIVALHHPRKVTIKEFGFDSERIYLA